MVRFEKAVSAWGGPGFEAALKKGIERLDGATLPLQQGLSTGSYALGDKLSAMIISSADRGPGIRVKAGIFFASVVAGCACTDDPTPVNEETEYCVVRLEIDKTTGSVTFVLLSH